MKRLAAAALGTLIAVSASACGGASSDATSPKNDGPSAKVVTQQPSAAAVPSPQPFNVGGYLAGNVKPTFPAGDPGKVSIVAEGPLDKSELGATLLVAYRNNTGEAISHVDLTATARLNGTLVASGRSQGGAPAQVQPGEIGLNYIYFDGAKSMPEDGHGLTYEFTADTSAADSSSYNTAALTVGEATYNGSSIVGTADNKTGKVLTGPYSVQVYCFEGGKLTDAVTSDFADQDGDVAANGNVSFTADLYDHKCGHFAVGVAGWFK